MKRIDIEEAFHAKAAPETGLEIVDSLGRRRAFFPVNKTRKGIQSFTAKYEIMRGDLCRILYDLTKDRAQYLFGTQIESYRQTAEYDEVHFSHGRVGTFDLIIGADGQNSRTRKLLFTTDGVDTAFHPLGSQYVAYFTIPKPILANEDYIASMFLTTHKRGIMTRRHNDSKSPSLHWWLQPIPRVQKDSSRSHATRKRSDLRDVQRNKFSTNEGDYRCDVEFRGFLL